jgi:hypothetical protein
MTFRIIFLRVSGRRSSRQYDLALALASLSTVAGFGPAR